jgi:hypothetical protein
VCSALGLQSLIQFVQKLLGVEVMLPVPDLVAVDADCQVLGHFAGFNGFDANRFQLLAKNSKFLIVINFGPEF